VHLATMDEMDCLRRWVAVAQERYDGFSSGCVRIGIDNTIESYDSWYKDAARPRPDDARCCISNL